MGICDMGTAVVSLLHTFHFRGSDCVLYGHYFAALSHSSIFRGKTVLFYDCSFGLDEGVSTSLLNYFADAHTYGGYSIKLLL